MNVAIIIAGGSGSRMGQDIPKQFINVYDKPVLVYTLEGFQKHPPQEFLFPASYTDWSLQYSYNQIWFYHNKHKKKNPKSKQLYI